MKILILTLICVFAIGYKASAQTPVADSLMVYTGTYSFESGSPVNKFFVTVDKGELYGEADSNGPNKLLKQAAANTFKSTSSYGSIITFTRDATTKASTGLTLAVQGTELQAKRENP